MNKNDLTLSKHKGTGGSPNFQFITKIIQTKELYIYLVYETAYQKMALVTHLEIPSSITIVILEYCLQLR